MSDMNRAFSIPEEFSIGEAITSHNGVVCYPAMRKDSDEKLILKTISLPASAVQLAALLLSGAYSSREAALKYYYELAQDIQREAKIVNELSTMEGFCPFLSCQLQEKDDRNGYQVSLLAPYRHSLEQILSENVMTHQDILDLAMDICSALAACRRAGYLYIDLKPGNIFYEKAHGYRIGDLGITSLSSLKYASLPDKYRSIYTAPEIIDASSQLNETLDVYALGLILYQAYNGGVLPMENDILADPLLPPLYADYEIAQIILTACHKDPAKRWPDPTSFGQALVQYMQTYGVSEGSIIPAPVSTPELDVGEEFLPEEDISDPAMWEDIPELEFMQDLVSDETAPSEEDTVDIASDALSEDTSQILAQADELMTLIPPDPVIAPEPIHVPMPAPIVLEEETPAEENPEQPAQTDDPVKEVPEEAPIPEAPRDEPQKTEPPIISETPPAAPEKEDNLENRKRRKTALRLIIAVLAIAFLIFLGVSGYNYYNDVYLQEIDDISIVGNMDSLVVKITTDADESLLQVTCSDTYGNTTTASVSNGTAIFTGLAPQTRYTIRVTIAGFHQLTGVTSDSFTTASQTKVDSFTVAIGPEDCSAYLNFTVSGAECNQWLLTYWAADIPQQSLNFTGHNVTVYDLIAYAEYTFTLSAADDSNVVGCTQVTYQARPIAKAKNPVITACGNGYLTVTWEQPDGEDIAEWIVRCYDTNGYEQTITTESLVCTFKDLTHEAPCTVEITAAGMPQGVSISIGANPINITEVRFEQLSFETLRLQWDFTGKTPEGGWLLNWSCDGTAPETLEIAENTAELPYIPGGIYEISLIPADGTAIFGHTATFAAPQGDPFSGHGITAQQLQVTMCATPEPGNWNWSALSQDAYKTDFSMGETAGFVVWCSAELELAETETWATYVLRDAEGNLIDISHLQYQWNTIWSQNICQLDAPFMPNLPGNYQLSIYFDGMLVTTQNFTIQ